MVFAFSLRAVYAGAPIAETPCDPLYYDSLESRAWLEAQREITQNQNLIFKPDSVLEYTCFDHFANVLARDALTMFSETQRWGVILDDEHMDRALDALVGDSLFAYLEANFRLSIDGPYDLLGGRTVGLAHRPKPITGDLYRCRVMNRVWQAAKCWDFIENPAEDGFFTFADYQEQEDKRYLPSRCAQDDRWESARFIAGIHPDFETIWPDDPITPEGEDSYLTRFDPDECGNFPGVPTGITVRRPQVPEYEERVCLQPGCYYDAADGCLQSN